MKSILIFVMLALMFSWGCGHFKNSDLETSKEGNITTTISTDVSKLAKLINLKNYRPTGVKFKYVLIDNSGQHQRLSVPGPSDAYLEAVLYFDNPTFNRLLKDNLKLSTISKGNNESYHFSWLDNNLKAEISQTNSSQLDHPPTFFQSGALLKGGYFVLTNKILLRLYTE